MTSRPITPTRLSNLWKKTSRSPLNSARNPLLTVLNKDIKDKI
jgi:hypothetical protein